MAQGTVKWFSDSKGYGFISAEDNKDYFVHHSGIDAKGFRSLTEGDEVRFDIEPGKNGKGPQAVNVRRI